MKKIIILNLLFNTVHSERNEIKRKNLIIKNTITGQQ